MEIETFGKGQRISVRYNSPPFRYRDTRASVEIQSGNEGSRYIKKGSVENGSLLMLSRHCEKER